MKLSRNDPCWCGSGKKYKKCHLDEDITTGNEHRAIKAPAGVKIKTPEQIEGIRKSCQLTKKMLDFVSDKVLEGVTTNELNNLVHSTIIEHGGQPAPLNYQGFPKSICTSLNEVVCHGIPNDTALKNGDIINVDITCIVDGFYGDAGRMFIIGEASEEATKLVKVAKECLDIGIKSVKPFHDLSEVGQAIETYANDHNYSVVREYGGHGIGLRFHEEPHVHHYGILNRGIPMLPNMVFTIEPMINIGGYKTKLLSDKWTVVTADESLSAQWEHTIRVTETGAEILTD